MGEERTTSTDVAPSKPVDPGPRQVAPFDAAPELLPSATDDGFLGPD